MLGRVGDASRAPIGVVLAGGAGRRLGGDKALVRVGGRPLIAYPLAAMRAALGEVVIVAKPDTALPAPAQMPGASVWIEPAEPRHPLVGIVYALQRAGGRPVLVCAADLPLITAAALRLFAQADAGGAPAVIAETADRGLQPLLGRYEPEAAALLEPIAAEGRAPVRAAVAAIGPRRIDLGTAGARLLFNVNSPEDLARAEELIGRRAP